MRDAPDLFVRALPLRLGRMHHDVHEARQGEARRIVGTPCRLGPLLILLAAPSIAAARPIRPPLVAPAPAALPAPVVETGALPLAPSPAALPQPLASSTTPAASSRTPAVVRGPMRTKKLPLSGMMDRAIVGVDKVEIGHVIDVLVDARGEPEAMLVETGGFLGLGDRKIAIGWDDVTFAADDPSGPVRANLTIEQVRSAPAYQQQRMVTVAIAAPPPPPGPPLVADAPPHLAAPEQVNRAPPVAAAPTPLSMPRVTLRQR